MDYFFIFGMLLILLGFFSGIWMKKLPVLCAYYVSWLLFFWYAFFEFGSYKGGRLILIFLIFSLLVLVVILKLRISGATFDFSAMKMNHSGFSSGPGKLFLDVAFYSFYMCFALYFMLYVL